MPREWFVTLGSLSAVLQKPLNLLSTCPQRYQSKLAAWTNSLKTYGKARSPVLLYADFWNRSLNKAGIEQNGTSYFAIDFLRTS